MNAVPIKFQRSPAINKGLDVVMAYPLPTTDSPFNLTPLSILYPGKMFEDEGKSVQFWDGRWDSQEMLDDYIKEAKELAVSCFTGAQCSFASDILQRAKQLNPKIVTHVGGHHAQHCGDDVEKEPFVDRVWRERSYHEHAFPFSPAAQRLWKRGDMQYMTSNGCPYGCTFCALRSPWKPRPLEQIERELGEICELTGATEFSFSDPNIGFDRTRDGLGTNIRIDRIERMKALGKILRNLGIKWDGNVRSDYVDQEYADLMEWAGCTSIEFGLESGDEWFLHNRVRKGHTVESGITANACMAKTSISVMNSFVKGMPYETKEQWLHTMEHIDRIMSIAPNARASVYKFTPYPGSPAYDLAVKGEGIEKFNPPKTMKEWGSMPLMADATYWVAGLNFRMDNTRANFPDSDWHLIEPYVHEAQKLWRERRPEEFEPHVADVEALVQFQVRKHTAQAKAA